MSDSRSFFLGWFGGAGFGTALMIGLDLPRPVTQVAAGLCILIAVAILAKTALESEDESAEVTAK